MDLLLCDASAVSAFSQSADDRNRRASTCASSSASRAFKSLCHPLEVQQEIVAEIEGYQRVIDGARAVVENYRPHIAVDPEWPMVALGDVCDFNH